jgi:hypothetical protein
MLTLLLIGGLHFLHTSVVHALQTKFGWPDMLTRMTGAEMLRMVQ